MYLPPEEWDEVGKWKTAVQTFLILAGFVIFVVVLGDLKFLSPLPKFQTPPLAPVYAQLEEEEEAERVQNVQKDNVTSPKPKEKTPEVDIALKKKKEQEEKRKKEEAEKKRKEKEKKEKERKEKERKKKEKEKKLAEEKRKKEAEQKRLDDLAAAKIADEKAANAQRLAGLQSRYAGYIITQIQQHLQTPPAAKKIDDLVVVVEVHLDFDGNFLEIPKVVESSNLPEYDAAAIRAVMKAAPLYMPDEPELRGRKEFRTHRLYISPK